MTMKKKMLLGLIALGVLAQAYAAMGFLKRE